METRRHLAITRLHLLNNALHVERALNRILPVGSDLAKAIGAVHAHSILHDGLNRVQADALVADGARLGQCRVEQRLAQALATNLWAHIEALHFANAGLQRVQGNATGEVPAQSRQQQSSLWRSVVAGQARQFLLETLKAQVKAERRSILLKKHAGFGEMLGCDRLGDGDGRGRRRARYPIRIPPFTLSTWPVM